MESPSASSRNLFVGREQELARFEAALEDARGGRGRLLLIGGPPGIGKSRLAAEGARRAADEGVRVLIGRSWEAGGAPAYWPWVQAIRTYLRAAGPEAVKVQIGPRGPQIGQLGPELSELLGDPDPPPPLDPESARFRLFDATASFLVEISRSEPLLIVLEDLQAADVPSLLFLVFLSRQLTSSSILILGTYRDLALTPDHPLAGTLVELHREPVTTDVALPGLNIAEVLSFVEAATGAAARRGVAAALHRQTGGNPLFLGETVRLLGTGEVAEVDSLAAVRVAMPPGVRAVIERRLHGLGDASRELLGAASVFGNEFDVETVGGITAMTVDDVLVCLGDAVAADLIHEPAGAPGRFRFTHDLIRDTLYAGLSPSERIGLHRSAADILEEAYGPTTDEHLSELALHHYEAAPGGDARRAASYCRRAGERAIRSLAYEEAVRLFGMAVRLLETAEMTDGIEFVELLLLLGDSRVRAGDLPGAGESFLRAADFARRVGEPAQLARAAIGYGGTFVWSRVGNDPHLVPLLQDALVFLGGGDDSLRARLLGRLSCALRSTVDRRHGDALSQQALDLARELGDPATLAYALTCRAGAVWWPENSEERLEIGRELEAVGEAAADVAWVVDGHMTQSAALLELGRVHEGRRQLETLGRRSDGLRLASHRWLNAAMKAALALATGEFAEVEGWVAETLAQGPTTPARDNVSGATCQRFLLRREQSRLAEVEESVYRAAVEFTWYPIHRFAYAYVLANTGRQPAARQILDELAADRFAALHRDNYWLASLCLASEVTVQLGDTAKAEVLYELLEPFSARNAIALPEGQFGSVARYLGLLAVARGDLEAADNHFGNAQKSNREMGAKVWLAHTLADHGRMLMDRDQPGDRERAVPFLVESADIASELGLVALEAVLADRPGVADSEKYRIDAAPAKFRRDGEYFSVAFEGNAFQLRDTKGMRYLAVVLASPGKEIHVLDLVSAVEGLDTGKPGAIRTGLSTKVGLGDAGPALDPEARRAYRQRLVDLEEELAEAEEFGDAERASRARGEIDFLATELAAAVGLGGRDRRAASPSERARINITRAIRAALSRITTHDPNLGTHLEATVHTGTFCSYIPDPRSSPRWQL